ncbi:hypothetical protein [Amantichitinum ursilacus]|uniref:Uncharacterized protein n=1 Tax=Amantichitinum ursilacus TaxID=857265 RepID=A0A0N0XH97_9NEIS|nr:hypothetical protein [Amantichitinum ursilacus]KPC50663.1 hypothetical protein WG78_16455 [Amantichitinum ursilacus]
MSYISIPDRRKAERINWAAHRNAQVTETAAVPRHVARSLYKGFGGASAYTLRPATMPEADPAANDVKP